MDSTVIVLIVIIVLLIVALGAAALLLSRRRRSERLQEHYGPEYERTVRESGDRRAAEAELTGRERRHAELEIRDLKPEEHDRFQASWSGIQQGFVDDPKRSVHAADRLVTDIMRTRGYPVDDFDRRAEDISVTHPEVVQRYRDARAVREDTDRGGDVDTDQQRRAVTSYRSLVDALLETETGTRNDAEGERRPDARHAAEGDRYDDRQHDDRQHDDRQHDDGERGDRRAERRPVDDRGPFGHQTEERTR